MIVKPEVPLLLALIGACSPGSRPAPARPPYALLNEALAAVRASDTSWHIGTNADCTNPFLKDMLSDNSAYEAYAATTDVDDDGHPDHLVALIKGDSGEFYWIPGREGGFVGQDGTIVFGRFYSDVSETWKWSPATRHLELVPEDSTAES